MSYTRLIVPDADGKPYYCISADGKEISLENYENGLRGFICEHREVTPKAFNLVAKFKSPDGRYYTIEIAPNGNILKATFYDNEPKANPRNFTTLSAKEGGPYVEFKREQYGL